MTYEFEFDSDALAAIRAMEYAATIRVEIDCSCTIDTLYDTPLGSVRRTILANWKLVSATTEYGEDVTDLFESVKELDKELYRAVAKEEDRILNIYEEVWI